MFLPKIIQGGMGAGVSNWRLAQEVAMNGHLGVVSGTALDGILVRRLQLGDCGGHMRRALAAFPVPELAQKILDRYFKKEGVEEEDTFKLASGFRVDAPKPLVDLTVVANFVEVFLAKEGHSGCVGINLLEKIQLPTLPSLFGAMLAGVDTVLMGAGIPRSIPGILDRLSKWEPVEMKAHVLGALEGESFFTKLDPVAWFRSHLPSVSLPVLKRPDFLAIVSSNVLAQTLARKATGEVNGFVVENHRAGGHNAPPRGKMQLSEDGEPIYTEKDSTDLEKLGKLGIPFWLAGGRASAEGLRDALAQGAAGIQVGTAFAFCEESGFDPKIKERVREEVMQGEVEVFTDPRCSPTGFPFKVLKLSGTLSDKEVYQERIRRGCDLCYLRQPYRKDDGTVGYRCPSEPVDQYLKKGGELADTEGRMCVCNALIASAGMGQRYKDGFEEPPLVTCGDDINSIRSLIDPATGTYSARDVLVSCS
jgi:nitronate monooxygenase